MTDGMAARKAVTRVTIGARPSTYARDARCVVAPLHRRQFLRGALALAGSGMLAGCGQVALSWQRSRKAPRVGILSLGTPASVAHFVEALRGGLRDLGYVEGRDIVLELRYAEDHSERYPDFVAELVQLDVAVIVANEPSAVQAVQQASADRHGRRLGDAGRAWTHRQLRAPGR